MVLIDSQWGLSARSMVHHCLANQATSNVVERSAATCLRIQTLARQALSRTRCRSHADINVSRYVDSVHVHHFWGRFVIQARSYWRLKSQVLSDYPIEIS
jgi:hypothetical protein